MVFTSGVDDLRTLVFEVNYNSINGDVPTVQNLDSVISSLRYS